MMAFTRFILVPIGLLGLFLTGCKDPENDMALQPKYEAYRAAEMFPDGASARQLVMGTVPREAVTNVKPPAVDRDMIARGQEQFDVFCSVCHGRLGNGMGMIVQRGFPRPPSFHIQRLIDAPDTHFYDVISNGFGAMHSYGDRVKPQQRWEIIAYVRALQLAPQAMGTKLSAEDRKALVAMGDRPAPLPPSTQPKEGQR